MSKPWYKTWRIVAVAALVVAVAVNADFSTSPAVAPTTPVTEGFTVPPFLQGVSEGVATAADCDFLQTGFDVAYNAHGNQSQVGAMEWLTDLMRRIDSRMEAVGCYG